MALHTLDMASITELKSLDDLNSYIQNVEGWLDSALSTLGLTMAEVTASDETAVCPVDSNHRMPASALHKHLKYCALRKKGCTDDEIDEENGSEFFYQKADIVAQVKLDLPTVRQICASAPGCSAGLPSEMPLTAERYTREFSQDQRLKIYEHVVQVAKHEKQQKEISEEQYSFLTEDLVKKQKKAEQERPKSQAELMAMKRDMKRRRQSYKGKSYTAKKSHKQIIAEVIHNQTEVLREMWTKEQELTQQARDVSKGGDTPSSRSSSRRRERSRSRERDRSQDYESNHRTGSTSENQADETGESVQNEADSTSSSKRKERSREHRKEKKHKKKERY